MKEKASISNHKRLKLFILKLHLWLGLISGAVVFVVALTGSIYVFKEELSDLIYKDWLFVEVPENTTRLPSSTLQVNAQQALGMDITPARLYLPAPPDRSAVVVYQKMNRKATLYSDYMAVFKRVYLNPYTGEVLKVENSKWEFFNVIMYLHMMLLLGPSVGRHIVSWSVVVFVVMLITGIVLWWPKRHKKAKKQALYFNWKKGYSWRRKNYDLHKILGFYSLSLALLMALTGLFWAFDEFGHTVKWIANGGQEHERAFFPSKNAPKPVNVLDLIVEQVNEHSPSATFVTVSFPRNEKAPYKVRAYLSDQNIYDRVNYFFDQNDAELLNASTFEEYDNGEKINALNYDLHVGAIGGIPTKIIYFLVSLIITSLPITGLLIYIGKKTKKKKHDIKSPSIQNKSNHFRPKIKKASLNH